MLHASIIGSSHLPEVHSAILLAKKLLCENAMPCSACLNMKGELLLNIRHRRLRAAAGELVKFPLVPVLETAYGQGFKSPQDFSCAFEMAPQDLRARTADWSER